MKGQGTPWQQGAYYCMGTTPFLKAPINTQKEVCGIKNQPEYWRLGNEGSKLA